MKFFLVLMALLFITLKSHANSCPDYDYQTLVGTWYGEQHDKKHNTWQRWTTYRYNDGTYKIEFETTYDDKVITAEETGYWSYSKCLYSVAGLTYNGKATNFHEVYFVNDINESYMEYTNYRTKNIWRIFRKN